MTVHRYINGEEVAQLPREPVENKLIAQVIAAVNHRLQTAEMQNGQE